ncbi:MAG: DpnD/PcfM family protein [Clostridia bacterium]|jgi:hypothetical protein
MEIKKYKVKIIETLEMIVDVCADSEKDAIETVMDDYGKEIHVLDYNNYKSAVYEIEK